MSHFVVVVTNTDIEPAESQLEPFCEECDENQPWVEKEYYVENNKKSVDGWLDENLNALESSLARATKELDEYKKKDRKELTKEELERLDAQINGSESSIKFYKSSIKKLREIKKMEKLSSQLDAIKDYEGGEKDSKGLYWLFNPQAKWDWWVEGGRWNNWLVTTWGMECNSCRVKDVDLDRMRINEMGEAAKYYTIEKLLAERDGRKMNIWGFDKVPTFEEYIESRNRPVAPFAILHDGKWIEKGDMGWFGLSDDKYSDEEWAKKFKELLNTLEPESEITIVDCHI